MLGTNVGFVWAPHVQQCPTMLAFVGINVGIVWPGLKAAEKLIVIAKDQSMIVLQCFAKINIFFRKKVLSAQY